MSSKSLKNAVTCIALLATLVQGRVALADVVQLVSIKDNTLYQEDGSLSNGAGQYLFTGVTIGGAVRHALFAFDVAGNIPAGSIIQSVGLQLHVSKTSPVGGVAMFDLRRVLADWGEGTSVGDRGEGAGAPATIGDATWTNTFWDDSGSPPTWTNPGGDFSDTPSASFSIEGMGFYPINSTDQMLADVQSFLDSADTNFGWIVIGQDDFANGSAKRFDSRENTNTTFRPVLTVTFAPPDP